MLTGNYLIFIGFLLIVIPTLDFYLKKFNESRNLLYRIISIIVVLCSYAILSGWVLHFCNNLTPSLWRNTTLIITVILTLLNRKPILKNKIYIEILNHVMSFSRTQWLFLIFVSIWAIFGFIRILILPSTNPDSQFMHLPIIINWLQDGFFSQFNSQSFMTGFRPINTYLLTMFQLSFFPTIDLIEIVQLESWILLNFITYGILKEFSTNQKLASTGTLLFMSCPIMLAISTTNQIDLIFLGLFAAFAYFFIRLYKYQTRFDSFFTNLLLAILAGAKIQGLVILPLIGLLSLLVLKNRKILKFHLIIMAVTIIVFTAPKFVMNYWIYASILPFEKIGVLKPFTFETVLFNVKNTIALNFLDRPWSIFGPVNYQHNTAMFGWFFSFIILPLSVLGTIKYFRETKYNLKNNPVLLFIIGLFLLLFFILTWQDKVWVYPLRLLILFLFTTFVFSIWTLDRIIKEKRAIDYKILYLIFLLMIFSSAFLYGFQLRQTLTLIISFLLGCCLLLFIKYPSLSKLIKNIIYVSFFFSIFTNYALSAIYDFRSPLKVIQNTLSQNNKKDNNYSKIILPFIDNNYLLPLSKFIEENSTLLIANINKDRPIAYIPLFRNDLSRRVKLLVSWQDGNREKIAIENLKAYFVNSETFWILEHIESSFLLPEHFPKYYKNFTLIKIENEFRLWKYENIEL